MEKNRLLGLMRFWLIGTFLIICAATTTYMVVLTGRAWLVAFQISYPVWGITAILCVAWYYIYKLYLKRTE
jgi:hypothetical protein